MLRCHPEVCASLDLRLPSDTPSGCGKAPQAADLGRRSTPIALPAVQNLRCAAAARNLARLLKVLQDPACIQLMRDFIKAQPALWNEDIGA